MEQIITLGLPLVAAILSGGVTWGMAQKSIVRLEQDHTELKDTIADLVPREQFRDVTHTLQDQVNEIQRDIKTILILLRNGNTRTNRKFES